MRCDCVPLASAVGRQFVHPSRVGVHEILQVHVGLQIRVPILVVTNRRFLGDIWRKRFGQRLRCVDEPGHDLSVVAGSAGKTADRSPCAESGVQQPRVRSRSARRAIQQHT
jgi:hypothetical protein